jgi:hypothetical protein
MCDRIDNGRAYVPAYANCDAPSKEPVYHSQTGQHISARMIKI